jgi:beta-carotene hydroxylase
VPALFALWVMMFVNYIQHVHCDPWSPHNHSRNFVSKLTNFWVFNNGFHAAHHEHAGAHWSALPALHAQIADQIDPALCEQTMFGFCFRVYLLGLVSEKARTHQVGRAPFDPPAGGRLDLTIGDVEAVEQGTNALPA